MASTSNKTLSNKILAAAIGRRKTAVVSVRLTSGKGEITVNDVAAEKYFPVSQRYNLPFKITGANKYAVSARVNGGGQTGQLDALVLGIARALVKIKEDFRKPLRDAGLLTRDSRERQRRMIGTGGKARRRKPSPKR